MYSDSCYTVYMTNHFAQAIVIFNPNSTGPSERNARRFAKRLERSGVAEDVKLLPTDHAGHAREIVAELSGRKGKYLVVASSGDGGYNEVVNGAMVVLESGTNIVTSLLPSGNANDHYKALHKPYVLRRIKNGTVRSIDVLQISGTVNGKPWKHFAHSYIGFGLSSEIGRELNKADLNPVNELIITAKAFVAFKPFTAKVNGKKQQYQSIIVSNVGKMSKFLSLSKKAKVDDGLFEVITSEPTKAKMIAALAKSATVGMPHESQVRSYSLEAIDALPVQCDGEVFTLDAGSKVRVTLLKHALHCVV